MYPRMHTKVVVLAERLIPDEKRVVSRLRSYLRSNYSFRYQSAAAQVHSVPGKGLVALITVRDITGEAFIRNARYDEGWGKWFTM